ASCLAASCSRRVASNRAKGGQTGSVGAMGGTAGAGGGQTGFDGGAPAGAGGAGGPTTGAINLDGSPIYTRVQRLTSGQWQRAVTDVLRLAVPADLSPGLSTPFAADATDFSN